LTPVARRSGGGQENWHRRKELTGAGTAAVVLKIYFYPCPDNVPEILKVNECNRLVTTPTAYNT